jgi:hypothetical protein
MISSIAQYLKKRFVYINFKIYKTDYFSFKFHKQPFSVFFCLSLSLDRGMVFLFLFAKNICTKRNETKKRNKQRMRTKRKKKKTNKVEEEKENRRQRTKKKTLYIVCSNNQNKQIDLTLNSFFHITYKYM